MRVIDLLNKIANNEEVPKKIFYSDKIWYWDIKAQDYVEDDKRLFNYYIVDELIDDLNDEVEIIQENSFLSRKEIELLDSNFKELGNKINEIIDYINKGE